MPAIFWAVCIFIASSIPGGKISWWLFHRFDKVIHITIFTVFGLLVYRALGPGDPPSKFSYKRVFFMLLIVLGYGMFDELHQGFTPGRSVDIKDLLADVAGGALSAGIVLISHIVTGRRMDTGRQTD
jgi:VanZ family protein